MQILYQNCLSVLLQVNRVGFYHTCDEIQHLKEWAVLNKLMLNFKKTKEIVLYSSGRTVTWPSSESGIEQVREVKLLGVLFNNHMSFNLHVNGIVSAVNQRFYLLKLLRAQGLNSAGLSVVFNAIILGKVMYASQAFCGHLKVNELTHIQSCLNKAYKWGFTTVRYNIQDLFDDADKKLFRNVTNNNEHCMHSLLPPKRELFGRQLRSRAHNFQLPQIGTTLLKNTFVNRCLFKLCY